MCDTERIQWCDELCTYRVVRVETTPKPRVLNPDIAEFFWATCERYKDEKLRKD